MDNKAQTAAEIKSREAIAAYQGIIELYKSGLKVDENTMTITLKWANSRLAPPTADAPKPESKNYIDDVKNLEFENRNKFYYGCQHYFKKLKKDVDPVILGLNLDDAGERKQAWEKVLAKFGGEPLKGG